MRTVHALRERGTPLVEPLCGAWGGMDDGWAEEADEPVTCPACRAILEAGLQPPALDLPA